MKAILGFDSDTGVHNITFGGLTLHVTREEVIKFGGPTATLMMLEKVRNVINTHDYPEDKWSLYATGDGFYVWEKLGSYQMTIAENPPTCQCGWPDLDALLTARGVSL